jgi:hypothetical protein
MEVDLVIFVTRAVTMVLSMLIGAMCILLGWKIHFEKIRRKTEINLEFKDVKFSITSSAPEIFFCLFGAALVLAPLMTRATYEDNRIDSDAPPAVKTNLRESEFAWQAATYNPAQNNCRPAKNDCACVYRGSSRRIKWFDRDETNSDEIANERQRISEAIAVSLPIIGREIQKYPNDEKLREAYVTLAEMSEEMTK